MLGQNGREFAAIGYGHSRLITASVHGGGSRLRRACTSGAGQTVRRQLTSVRALANTDADFFMFSCRLLPTLANSG